MAVLLGSTSVLIFRKQRLVYSVSNQTATKEKIDQFGEFIEGEVMDGDDIIVV
jgi:adenylate cyclase class IV